MSTQEVEEAYNDSPYRNLFNNLSSNTHQATGFDDHETPNQNDSMDEPTLSQDSDRTIRRAVEPTMSQSEDGVISRDVHSSSSFSSSNARARRQKRKDDLECIGKRTEDYVVDDVEVETDEADAAVPNIIPARSVRSRKRVEVLNIETMSSAKEQYRVVPSSSERSPSTGIASSPIVIPPPTPEQTKQPVSRVRISSLAPLKRSRMTEISNSPGTIASVAGADSSKDIH